MRSTDPAVQRFQPAWAVRAHLLARAGRLDDAARGLPPRDRGDVGSRASPNTSERMANGHGLTGLSYAIRFRQASIIRLAGEVGDMLQARCEVAAGCLATPWSPDWAPDLRRNARIASSRAARQVISERGYHAANPFSSDRRRRPTLSRPTLHYYFDSREQIYADAGRRGGVMAECIDAARRKDTLIEQLGTLVWGMLEVDRLDRSRHGISGQRAAGVHPQPRADARCQQRAAELPGVIARRREVAAVSWLPTRS